MKTEEAAALAQFINDHDTRFEAKAMTDAQDGWVLLTRPEDGTQLEPVRRIVDYGAQYIDGDEPGPTIRGAWERWLQPRA